MDSGAFTGAPGATTAYRNFVLRTAVLGAVVCGSFVVGCGGSDGKYTQAPERSHAFIHSEAQKAKRKVNFPVLWLGPSFDGYGFNELTTQRHVTGGAPAADVIYGDCQIPSGQEEGGCSVPYEVQQRNACDVFMVRLARREGRSGPNGTLTYSEDGAPVIITGRTRVKIYGADAKAAVHQLRPLGQTGTSKVLRPAAQCTRG
jgi:hypothetical protein